MQDDLQKAKSYRSKMTIINATRDLARSFAKTQVGQLCNNSIGNNSIVTKLSILDSCECSGKASGNHKTICSITITRIRHQRHSKKKLLLKIAQYLQENTFWSLFWTLKQVLQNKCFPKNSKIWRTPFLKNLSERLPLYHHNYFMAALSLYINIKMY